MTPQENLLLEAIRDSMREMMAESRERNRTLQNIKVIVQGMQQEMAALERRLALLERTGYSA